jgi:hypothetical protein
VDVDGLIRVVAKTALVPWGGSLAVLDRYEAGIRMATNLQLNVARTVRVEPIRTLASTLAGVTRDVGAAQLSVARWFLDD